MNDSSLLAAQPKPNQTKRTKTQVQQTQQHAHEKEKKGAKRGNSRSTVARDFTTLAGNGVLPVTRLGRATPAGIHMTWEFKINQNKQTVLQSHTYFFVPNPARPVCTLCSLRRLGNVWRTAVVPSALLIFFMRFGVGCRAKMTLAPRLSDLDPRALPWQYQRLHVFCTAGCHTNTA